MVSKADSGRMRRALKEIAPAKVRQLIAICRDEDVSVSRRNTLGSVGVAAATTYPGRLGAVSREQFLQSCSDDEVCALWQLCYWGRDGMMATAADFEAVGEDPRPRAEIEQHLLNKSQLADYLEKGLVRLGL